MKTQDIDKLIHLNKELVSIEELIDISWNRHLAAKRKTIIREIAEVLICNKIITTKKN